MCPSGFRRNWSIACSHVTCRRLDWPKGRGYDAAANLPRHGGGNWIGLCFAERVCGFAQVGFYRGWDRPCGLWRSGDGLDVVAAVAGSGFTWERGGNLLCRRDFLPGGGVRNWMADATRARLFGYGDWDFPGGIAGLGIPGAGGV